MKSLLKRITGDQGPAEGDATGFPQAVANSVHSLLQRITGPGTPPADEVPVRMAVSLFFFMAWLSWDAALMGNWRRHASSLHSP